MTKRNPKFLTKANTGFVLFARDNISGKTSSWSYQNVDPNVRPTSHEIDEMIELVKPHYKEGYPTDITFGGVRKGFVAVEGREIGIHGPVTLKFAGTMRNGSVH